jgi:ferritin
VTLVLSKLSDVEKVRRYYDRLTASLPEMKEQEQETEAKLREMAEASKDIPAL